MRRSVRTLHIAKLALITEIGDMIELYPGKILYFAIFFIDIFEQISERRAEVEAETASVTDVPDTHQFFLQRFFLPEFWIFRMYRHKGTTPQRRKAPLRLCGE